MSRTVLEMNDVTMQFGGVVAVDSFSMHVDEGEIVSLGDDYSVGLCNYFIKAFEALGGVVVYETFPEGTSDFAAYVANAKKSGCDVFFSPVSIEAAALIIEQANTQGLTMPILAGDTWDSNVVLGAAKGTKVNVSVTTLKIKRSERILRSSSVTGVRFMLKAMP